ncbi:MAG: formate C-acetyltransferase/glycerol dehydratase family glycyl radical enzyme [Deltaproteobacteria bacterium]|nr:formate C-acetyltransferase/glycerol dehydratase family glycyl radical enzyme [Deltaproteobacteria bacterium]
MLAEKQYFHVMPESRIARLRNRIIDAPQEVCVERARYFSRSMREHWNQHPLTRMSMAFADILDNITVTIRDDEFIVGCRTTKLKGAPLFPENKSKWIEGDTDAFDTRFYQRALITDEEKTELKEEILPFWKGKTIEDKYYERVPSDVEADMDKYIFIMILEINYGIGHFTMDHPRILAQGLRGIIEDAERRKSLLSADDQKGEKGLFYDAAICSMQAAIRFARRYSTLAESLAKKEKDPARAEELKRISRICARVPEFPAGSFEEAIQCVYFIHLIAQIETGGNSISLGRIDQILAPYYEADKKAGRITPGQAREMMALLFIKTNEIWNVLEEVFIPGGECSEGKTTQNVTVGGVGTDGEDATCELSRIGLDAFADVRTVQPDFGVRLSPKSPDDFFMKAVEYAKDGVPLHFFNDHAIIKALVNAGHSLEDARNYGVVGCLEPNAQGKTFGSTFAVQVNGIKCVEFALSNGIDNTFGYQSGIKTGDPAAFTSFEDVWDAYTAQMSHFIGQMVRGMAQMDEIIARGLPSPFASAMIEGPLEKGIDLTSGGAVYNSTGVQFIGFANVVDSLYAVKKAVFEDKTVSIAELAGWLASDWDDAEDKRLYFLNKIPKYGNDVDEVDEMASRVLNHFCDELAQYKNYRGGAFWPGVFSVGFHIAFGSFTAATPDGRASGEVLGNGLTPSTGNALSGPTAVMNSVTKLPLVRVCNGGNLNMRFSAGRIQNDKIMAMMKSYFERGGMQVQYNVIDSEVLLAAKEEPEKYRDLVVRISGYSTLFTCLTETAQDEIISRTTYGL